MLREPAATSTAARDQAGESDWRELGEAGTGVGILGRRQVGHKDRAYRIDRPIAEGGMGSVYEAKHLCLPKRFAVEVLNVSLTDNHEAQVRLRCEAEILAALEHPAEVAVVGSAGSGRGGSHLEARRRAAWSGDRARDAAAVVVAAGAVDAVPGTRRDRSREIGGP